MEHARVLDDVRAHGAVDAATFGNLRLEHIDEYSTSPLYDPVERMAIAYADAMTAQPTTVTDEQVAELERALGRAGLVELTTQIGLENMRARVNHALGITSQGFDAACAVRSARR